MIRTFKYVVFEECFVRISGEYDTHKDMARSFDHGIPTSAGFADLAVVDGKLNVAVWGQSESFGLAAKPEDEAVILKLFVK